MLLKALAERRRDERGVYAILFAILVVVLFTMVAIGVDLSDARAEVRANQSRVDFAGLAAGAFLAEGDSVAACDAAWAYLLANTPGIPSAGITSPCDNPPIPLTCPSTPWVGTPSPQPDPYTIQFMWPVPNSNALLGGRVEANDGNPCERFGISITTDRSPLFGNILGSGGLSAPAISVVRGFDEGRLEEPIALLLLDPIGCIALEANGGGSSTGGAQVFPIGDTTGKISVDSNGSGSTCDNRDTIDVSGSGGAPGRIYSCGVGSDPAPNPPTCTDGGKIEIYTFPGGTCVSPYCEQADIDNGQIKPQPVELDQRRTRAPVDAHANCQPRPPGDLFYRSKAGVAETWPASEVPLEPCMDPKSAGGMPDRDGDGYTSDYVDELRAYVGTTGCPVSIVGNPDLCDVSEWFQYPVDYTGTLPNDPCRIQNGDSVVLPLGNWWINCPGGMTVAGGGSIQILGGNVVMQAGFQVNGNFFMNTASDSRSLPSTCVWNGDDRPDGICPTRSETSDYNVSTKTGTTGASYIYLRNGNFTKNGTGAIIRMLGTFMYINDGVLDLTGGAAELTWIAPYHGTFEDLNLWSERAAQHRLTGSSSQNIEGAFFTPYANPFNYAGGGAQDQTKAQFLSYRLRAGGNGLLKMAPDPERSILFPAPVHYLIR